jgi:hypothetical protein
MEDTTPMPVTTTRLIQIPFQLLVQRQEILIKNP